MCGIVGITGPNVSADETLLMRMISTIAHRGPNHSAARIEHHPGGNVGLGYCRLSILDLTPAGNQPMCNETGNLWIIYNGELYNHPQLRRELEAKGHQYRSRTDTETVLHAYEEWDVEAFNRFNGMFALAIYDRNAGSLVLARDRRGIKPLYYAWDGSQLAFASELKALLKTGLVRPAIDPTALWLFLCLGYVPSPYCLIAGVHKLDPGNYLELKNGNFRIVPFSPQTDLPVNVSEKAEPVDLVRAAVEQAVRQQLMSDVPVGVFLSGGLDSTVVAALAAKHHDQPIHTFSVGYERASGSFEIEPRYNDDFFYARKIASSLGTTHHEIIVENNCNLPALFKRLIFQLDEPMVEPVFLSTHYLSKLARHSGVPVVLTGDGADELFGGYDRYFAAQRLAHYRRVPGLRRVLPLLEAVGSHRDIARNAGELKYLLDHRDAIDSYIRFSTIFRPPQALNLLSPDLREQVETEALNRVVEAAIGPRETFVDQMAHADLRLWVGEHFNPRLDRISMLHSVEARVPFQDDIVVKAALSIPTVYKSNRSARKWLLKHAFADIVPNLARTRVKRAYQAPGSSWMQGGLNGFYRELVERRTQPVEFFDPVMVRQYAENWGNETPGQALAVSALMIADLWLQLSQEEGEEKLEQRAGFAGAATG